MNPSVIPNKGDFFASVEPSLGGVHGRRASESKRVEYSGGSPCPASRCRRPHRDSVAGGFYGATRFPVDGVWYVAEGRIPSWGLFPGACKARGWTATRGSPSCCYCSRRRMGYPPGKEVSSLPPPPLRTVLVTFTTHGSSKPITPSPFCSCGSVGDSTGEPASGLKGRPPHPGTSE